MELLCFIIAGPQMLDRTGHITPCRPLDITPACQPYRSVNISFRTQEPKPHAAMIVITKLVTESTLMGTILSTRGLSPSIASLSVHAAFLHSVDSRLKTIAGVGRMMISGLMADSQVRDFVFVFVFCSAQASVSLWPKG